MNHRCLALLFAFLPLAAQELTPFVAPQGFDAAIAPWKVAYGRADIVTDPPQNGAGCVRVQNAGGVTTGLLPYQGEHLVFSWWMRTDQIERGPQSWHRALGQINTFDAERKPIRHFDGGATLGTTPWTRHEMTAHFEPKVGVAFIEFTLINWNATGTSWFDDARVDQVPPPEAFRKVPPLEEIENQAPVRWPLPEVKPLVKQVDTGPLQAEFGEDGEIAVTTAGPTVRLAGVDEVPVEGKLEVGTTIDRGFMTQQSLAFYGPLENLPRVEAFCELFRGSPIVSIFRRLWLDPGASALLGYRIELDGTFDRMLQFVGNQPVAGLLDEIALRPETTTKPFVVYHDAADTAGVVVYLPHPAEQRRWFIEDYRVEQTAPVVLSVAKRAGGLRLALTVPTVTIERGPGWRASLDLPVFLMPYAGTAAEALQQFRLRDDLLNETPPLGPPVPRGYWEPRQAANTPGRLLRMARYFPTEFASWISGDEKALTYGHPDGYSWTVTNLQMKGIRVDPLATGALARDHAFRMLTFFVTAAGEKGAPSALNMYRPWAGDYEDPKDLRKVVFCQFWEYRLGEYQRLFQSPLLTFDEKTRIYAELQRARYVYDPASPGTWSVPTPNGGLWFKYLDLPRDKPNQWVINTHTTSVGNVGEFARLAKQMNQPADEAFWTDLFRRGIDGLLYATGEDWMWYVDDHDPNELRYGGNRGGPRGYHSFMITAWVPWVMDLALELAPESLPALLALERRMMSAEYLAEDSRTVQMGEEAIRRVEATITGD